MFQIYKPTRLFIIRMIAEPTRPHTAMEIGRFLYTVNLVYEVSRVISDSGYASYRFSKNPSTPRRSRLKAVDRLYVHRLREESPIELVLAFLGGLAAPSTIDKLAGAIEKIAHLPATRDKIRAETAKIWAEAAKAWTEVETLQFELEERKRVLGLQPPFVERREAPLTKGDGSHVDLSAADKPSREERANSHYQKASQTLRLLPFRAGDFDVDVVSPEEWNKVHGR